MAAVASTSTSMAAATAVLMRHRPAAKNGIVFSPLSNRPSLSYTPLKQLKGVCETIIFVYEDWFQNLIRTKGGIPPLVELLRSTDVDVKLSAARVIVKLNIDNKDQIVELEALHNLVSMMMSVNAKLHHEAVEAEHVRSSRLVVKASSSDETPLDVNELLTDLKEKWDAVENKSTIISYGGGAVVGVWLAAIVVGAVDSIPLLPKIMELVGLGYTGWFVYRYLLFESGRKELATDIEDIKKKIAGTE